MKDQYFGDVNDYRKYGLLRAITEATGLRVAVCWLLTARDARRDGELRRYLHDPAGWRSYDPELYDRLRLLLSPGVERSTKLAESWGLVPQAVYQPMLLSDGEAERQEYFEETWSLVRDVPLLFFDPDNGIEVPSVPHGRRGSSKYLFWHELEEAARRGHSILVYQHFPRVARTNFTTTLANSLRSRLGVPAVLVFRSANVAFFLVVQESHRAALLPAASLVSERWTGQFDVSVCE